MTGELILVVEDNEALRNGICEMLTLEGYQVIPVRNGDEAVMALDKARPDLILSDLMMPGMNGFDLYSAVRNRSELIATPFIFLTARTDPADLLIGRTLGVDDYLTKPVTRDELVTAIRSRLSRYTQVKLAQVQQAYQASLTMLADAIESRGSAMFSHIGCLTEVALSLAKIQNWNERALTQLRFGAILHDIGKLNVPDEILLKEGPLNEVDWNEIRRHPQAGAEMIRGIPFLSEVAPLIRHHHERWDGKGYPDGLAALEIPAGARILAVVDAFDTMISKRIYMPALTFEDACDEIIRCESTQFDPEVVECFRKAWSAGTIHEIYSELEFKFRTNREMH